MRHMIVAELIEQLKQVDPALRVVTPGFDESDLDDIGSIALIKVAFHDEIPQSHCGRHVESENGCLAIRI